MAEAPPRYCGNCGHALEPQDRFCQNCGTPVHQAAQVPTPEADVPVPPSPQQAGSAPPEAQQQRAEGLPPEEPTGRRNLLLGCFALFLLLIVGVIVLAGAGGGGGEQAADSPPERNERDEGAEGGGADPEAKQPLQGEEAKPRLYQVGDTAEVANVEWTITDAYYTEQLRSTFGTQKRGNFVVVDFTFTNNRNEEVTLDPELHMILKDAQGREFGTDLDAWEFVPTNLNIFLEPVNPGISKDGRVIYQVPADAKGFTLTVDDVELLEDKSAKFDLGNLPSRSFDPGSASPTATATATATAGQ